jgi:hypothetical protein
MTDELRKRMARLRELAPRLNSATDQASRLVAMVEKFLVDELHIGISAESSDFASSSIGHDGDGDKRMIRQRLAFGRVGPSYRIHVVDETHIVDRDGNPKEVIGTQATPLPSCGRETKLKAVEKLPELLDRIIHESERLAETAGDTASKIGALMGDGGTVTVAAPQLAPQVLACPWCGEKGKCINVEAVHWGVCGDCEVKWPIGTNLLPSWRDESERDWARNAALLAGYSDAE